MTIDIRKIQFIAISLLSFIIYQVNAESLEHKIPLDRGEMYRWAWLMYTLQTGLGIILNVFVLDLFLSLDNTNKSGVYSLNVALNVVDILLLLEIFIRSLVSYAANAFYGGYHQEVFCYLDDVLNASCVLWSICIIVAISYLARLYLCTGEMLTHTQVFYVTFGCWLYSVAAAFIGIYLPGHGFGLDASGTFCFVTPSITTIPIIFFFSLVLPFNFLIYNLYHIQRAIADSQKLLEELGVEGQAKVGYIQMVKKFGYFLIALCFCEFPILINSISSIITNQYASPNASIVAGVIALSNAAYVNPCLFIYLNVDLRDKMAEKYSWMYDIMLKLYKQTKKYTAISPELSHAHSIKSIKVGAHNNTDYEDWKIWMSEDCLKKALQSYGKSIYAMENLNFYEDVMKYHAIGESQDDISLCWEELNRFANRMYILYIKIPRAPLEININYGTRNILLKILLHGATMKEGSEIRSAHSSTREMAIAPEILNIVKDFKDNMKDSNNIKQPGSANIIRRESIRDDNKTNKIGGMYSTEGLEVIFPDLTRVPSDDIGTVAHEYIHAFDECLEVVSHIIATDIWPRFKKSQFFDAAKKEHQHNMSEKC